MSSSKRKSNPVRFLSILALITFLMLNTSLAMAAETTKQGPSPKVRAIISADDATGKLIEVKRSAIGLKSTTAGQTASSYKVAGVTAQAFPEILNIEVTPNVNVGEYVQIEVTATGDNLADTYLGGRFVGPNNNQYLYFDMWYDSTENVFKGEMNIGQFTNGGVWTLDSMYVVIYGDFRKFSGSELGNPQFTVNNTTFNSPEILSITTSPSTASYGDTLEFSVEANTNGVEVESIFLYLENTSPDWNLPQGVYLSYNPSTNRWEGEIYVDEYFSSGTWVLDLAEIQDSSYVYTEYYQDDFPNFQLVVNNSYNDGNGPEIIDSSIFPSFVNVGDTVTLEIEAMDAEGADWGGAYFTTADGENGLWFSIGRDPIYNNLMGTLLIEPWVVPGVYQLDYLYIDDIYYNESFYEGADLPHLQFEVSNPNYGTMPTLSLNPSQQDLQPGQQFTVSVDIENVQNLFGAEAKIFFDPSQLAVVDIDSVTTGTQIDLNGVVSAITVKNQVVDGEIWFSTAKQGYVSGFSGDGTIATITFEVLATATVGTSPITFGITKLSDDSEPPIYIQHDYQNAVVDILPGPTLSSIEGYVKLQGLNHHGGALVQLEGTNIYAYTEDSYGYFKLDDIPEGSYKLVVYSPDWKPVFLTKMMEIYLGASKNVRIDGTITLRTGDINSDNKVGLLDLSQLAQGYGYYDVQNEYNYMADLNDNLEVDLFDLVLMAKNWGQLGYGG